MSQQIAGRGQVVSRTIKMRGLFAYSMDGGWGTGFVVFNRTGSVGVHVRRRALQVSDRFSGV